MNKRDRLALVFGAAMAVGALATGDAVAEDAPVAAEGITQQIGVTASSYKYTEDQVMSLKGPLLGLDYAVKLPITHSWFAKGDLHYGRGKLDYDSTRTGSAKNETSWYFEPRFLSGYDFAFGNHTLSPYTGFGFRYLYNDARGTSSTGNGGYRRESRYFYLPLGLAHRWAIGERSGLTTTIEYDYLIEGRQTSELGDYYVGLSSPTGHGATITSADALKNDQKTGHGWRGSIMLQLGNWTMGPYASYWRISDSVPADFYMYDSAGYRIRWSGWYEPKNKTEEAGFKVNYLF